MYCMDFYLTIDSLHNTNSTFNEAIYVTTMAFSRMAHRSVG